MADIDETLAQLEKTLQALTELRDRCNTYIRPLRDTHRRIKAQMETAQKLTDNATIAQLLRESLDVLADVTVTASTPRTTSVPAVTKPKVDENPKRGRPSRTKTNTVVRSSRPRSTVKQRTLAIAREADTILRYAFDGRPVPPTFDVAVQSAFPDFATRKIGIAWGAQKGIEGRLLRDVLLSDDALQLHARILNAVERMEMLRTGQAPFETASAQLQQLYAFLNYEQRWELIAETLHNWRLGEVPAAS